MLGNNHGEIQNRLFLGLDLGQAKDFSALAIIDRTDEIEPLFNCVHLNRWPLRTSYPQIVADVVKLIFMLPPQQHRPTLAVDATGVGAPVVDLFKQEAIKAHLMPILIVGGATVSNENGVTRVPKRDLVSTVQVALQNRSLKIAAGLTDAAVLSAELQNFQVKITDAANDTYGAWREGTHDDLVLATAMALWVAAQPSFTVAESTRELFQTMADRRW